MSPHALRVQIDIGVAVPSVCSKRGGEDSRVVCAETTVERRWSHRETKVITRNVGNLMAKFCSNKNKWLLNCRDVGYALLIIELKHLNCNVYTKDFVCSIFSKFAYFIYAPLEMWLTFAVKILYTRIEFFRKNYREIHGNQRIPNFLGIFTVVTVKITVN